MGKRLSDDAMSDSGESSDSVSSSAESSPEESNGKRASETDDSSSASSASSGLESEDDSSSTTDTEDEKSDSSEKKYELSSRQESHLILTFVYRSSSNLSFAPPKAFKPPSGFKRVKEQSPPSSSVSSLLSNLQGKQVFHVTAPAFLPLSAVREVSLAKVMRGEPVLNYKGVDYGIPTESQQEHGAQALLLYNKETGTYQSAPVRNIPSYHVQELVSLPSGSLVPPTAAQESSNALPRQQPKHMKMRFRPVGSVYGPPETIGTSSESEAEEPKFKFPERLKNQHEERKRKNLPIEDSGKQTDMNGSARKKSKKHSSSQDLQSSQTDPVASSQATSQDAQEERSRKDSSHKHKKSHKHKDETSQERKARKEEKKKKKAEKAA